MTRRFAGADEEAPISVGHVLALASTVYAFLKDGDSVAALKIQGLLIGYLKGNGGNAE